MLVVKSAGGPAQQVHVVIVGAQLRPVVLHRHRVQLGGDAHLCQHARDRLTDGFVVQVAVVRALQTKGETIRVTRFGKQRLGLFRIISRALRVGGREAAHRRADQLAGRLGRATHDGGEDGVHVDGTGHRFAHLGILEGVRFTCHGGVLQRVRFVAKAQHDHARFDAADHLGAFALIDARGVLDRDRVDHVHVTGQQRSHGSRGIVDRCEGGGGDVVLHLVPPARKGLQRGGQARLAVGDNEWPRAVGVQRGVVASFLVRARGRVGLGPAAVHDHPVGDAVGEQRVGRGGVELHREIVDDFHVGDRRKPAAHIRCFVRGALVAEQHVFGGKGRAVVEGHAFAQHEPPAFAVTDRLP